MKKYLVISLLIFSVFAGCHKKEEWDYSSLFLGFAIEGFPITHDAIQAIEQETKIAPQVIQFYLQWPEPTFHFHSITSSLDAIWKQNAIPCITWEPRVVKNEKEINIPSEEILNGNYDSYLSYIAVEAKQWQKPIIVRFAHEMNLEKYHWGFESKEEFGSQAPDIYIKMFRYVVSFFKKKEVTNILWVFCPNVDSVPNEKWNRASQYYPGDEFVDILGMDGYNWAVSPEIADSRRLTWQSPWRSFESTFYPLYQELKALSHDKPIIVFETSSAQRPLLPNTSEWIKDAIKVAKTWKILGIIWFQVNKEEDWRINQNEDYSYVDDIKNASDSFQLWLVDYLNKREKKLKEM